MIDDDSPRSGRPRSGSSRSRRRRAPEGKAIETTTNEEYLAGLSSAADLFEGEASTPQEESHGHRRRRRRRHRPWWKRHKVATGLLVLLLVSVLGVAGAALWVRHALASISTIHDPFAPLPSRAPYASTQAEDSPVTFLVLGSDSRIDTDDPSQWEVGAQRTDTIMIVQVSGDRENVNVMSIPRDSWVTIPANEVQGEGQAKINAAYSWGGPTLLIQTVELNTGIHIDHFAVANFESFQQLTDELGGVEITLTQPLDLTGKQDPENSSSVLEPGTHVLTGEQALIYARERYTLPNGDFDRIKRQQNWMRAILTAAISRDTLTNPTALAGLISTVKDTVATDEGFSASVMTDLATSMSGVRSRDVAFFQAPVTGTGTSEDGQSIVLLDTPRLNAVAQAFQTDTVTQYVRDHAAELNMLGYDVS